MLSDKLQERVLLDVLERSGLTGPDQNRRGKMLHYDLKYSLDSQAFDYPYAAGTELLTPSGLEHGQKIALKPWGAAIVEQK